MVEKKIPFGSEIDPIIDDSMADATRYALEALVGAKYIISGNADQLRSEFHKRYVEATQGGEQVVVTGINPVTELLNALDPNEERYVDRDNRIRREIRNQHHEFMKQFYGYTPEGKTIIWKGRTVGKSELIWNGFCLDGYYHCKCQSCRKRVEERIKRELPTLLIVGKEVRELNKKLAYECAIGEYRELQSRFGAVMVRGEWYAKI